MQDRDEQILADALLAESYCRAGKLYVALELCPDNISPDTLITCGKVCQAKGDYPQAFRAYKHARAAANLLELGDLCAKAQHGSAEHDTALECFTAVCSPERLIALGNKYLTKTGVVIATTAALKIALEAFKAAKARRQLEHLGDACFQDESELALEAYQAAGAVEKLILLGDHFMAEQAKGGSSNLVHNACKAYRAAGAHDKLLLCANWYLGLGKDSSTLYQMEYGFKIYKEVGVEVPRDLLQEILDYQVENKDEKSARSVSRHIASGLVNQRKQPAE